MTDEQSQQTIAEIFWNAAEPPSEGRTARDVVLHALMVLRAFDLGEVSSGRDDSPLRLMSLVAEMGLEEDLVYASPELVRGESFDVRALVFTIGVLIFERLTDRHPFGSSDNPTRLARLRRGEMGSGVNYLPSVPKDLRAILMRAMGPFPEERYGALAELRRELARFVDRPDLAGDQADAEGDTRPHAGRRAVIVGVTEPPTAAAAKKPSGQVAKLREHRPPALETPEVPSPDAPRVAGGVRAHDSIAEREHEAVELAEMLEPESTGRDAAPAPASATPPATPDDYATARLPRLERALGSPPAPTPAAAPRSKVTPVLWALAGAAVASVLFVAVGGRFTGDGEQSRAADAPGSATGSAKVAAPANKGAPTRTVATKTTPLVDAAARTEATSTKPTSKVDSTAAAPTPDAAPPAKSPEPAKTEASKRSAPPAKTVAIKKTPAPPTSSSDSPAVAAGKRVVAAIEPCKLRRLGGPEVRVAVYLAARRSKAVRGFVGRQRWMSRAQVRCVKRHLAGLELGLRLSKPGFVEWGLRLRPDSVVVRLRRPKRLPLAR